MLSKTFRMQIVFCISLIFQPFLVYALDGIIRPYQSVRSAGMGGVRITTGLYDENFFNNPARVTANPESKLTLFQMMPFETTPNTVKEISEIAKGEDALKTVANRSGTNLHDRFQLILPAYYFAAKGDRKFALAIGLISSLQIDASVRSSFQTSFDGVYDFGPALTVGYKFLRNDALSVGITSHLTYRLGTGPDYGLLDYVRGTSMALKSIGGEGTMYDFDFGATYDLGIYGSFRLSMGAAVQNSLGGKFSNLSLKPLNIASSPPLQPRSYGLGISATRRYWGYFKDTVMALEVTDIGNNQNGSFYKLLHLGGETHLYGIALRLGLNQGYMAGGLGFDLHYINLDLATYGEELGLNAGTYEDRRYTVNLGLHI